MCQHRHREPRRDALRKLGGLGLAPFLLSPLALAVSGCNKEQDLAEGMAPIIFDRDTCTRCSMVISDRRFAGQIRGGPKDTVFKFDDVGCMVFWLRDKADAHPWLAEAATRMWIADLASKPGATVWHDPRLAHYVNKLSPMGYNYAAVAAPQAGSLDFAGMRERVLAKGK